jgi:hypothetical protein
MYILFFRQFTNFKAKLLVFSFYDVQMNMQNSNYVYLHSVNLLLNYKSFSTLFNGRIIPKDLTKKDIVIS